MIKGGERDSSRAHKKKLKEEALEANEANQTAIASISKLKANQFEVKWKKDTKQTQVSTSAEVD